MPAEAREYIWSPELELEMAVSLLKWVLGTRLRSCGRAASILTGWAVSPVPGCALLKNSHLYLMPFPVLGVWAFFICALKCQGKCWSQGRIRPALGLDPWPDSRWAILETLLGPRIYESAWVSHPPYLWPPGHGGVGVGTDRQLHPSSPDRSWATPAFLSQWQNSDYRLETPVAIKDIVPITNCVAYCLLRVLMQST